jgi:hypothetical protein
MRLEIAHNAALVDAVVERFSLPSENVQIAHDEDYEPPTNDLFEK